MTTAVKPVGIALSGAQLVALLEDRDLTRRLDLTPVSYAIAGIDRIDPAAHRGPTVESTIAVAVLSARTPNLGWLAAAAAHRDHPYNLARRVASTDHLSNGRAGLVLGLRDAYAPDGPDGHEVWGGAGLSDGFPVAIETTADAAEAIRKLWQSWPSESIVFDRDTRIYAQAEQIVHIDHHGVFDVAGPLTVPTTPQGAPVLAWRAVTAEEASAARRAAEAVIWPTTGSATIDEIAAAEGSTATLAEIALTWTHEPRRLISALELDERVTGIILRPDDSPEALRQFLDVTIPFLHASGAIGEPRSGTLRERLDLAPPSPLLPAGARAAFPAPAPWDEARAMPSRR